MSTFFEWFDALDAEAAQTNDGKLFMGEGFVLHHTGGGCTAWRRDIDIGSSIFMTDSGGTDHRLGASYAIDPGRPDCWLVGIHHDDESSDSVEASTAAEAIATAQRLADAAR